MLRLMEFSIDLEAKSEEEQKAALEAQLNKKPFIIKIKMPDGANVLRAGTRLNRKEVLGTHPETKQIGRFQVNEEVACLWVEANDDYELVERVFAIVATGFEVPAPGDVHHIKSDYVGTFLLGGGQHAFHVYQDVNPVILK